MHGPYNVKHTMGFDSRAGQDVFRPTILSFYAVPSTVKLSVHEAEYSTPIDYLYLYLHVPLRFHSVVLSPKRWHSSCDVRTHVPCSEDGGFWHRPYKGLVWQIFQNLSWPRHEGIWVRGFTNPLIGLTWLITLWRRNVNLLATEFFFSNFSTPCI